MLTFLFCVSVWFRSYTLSYLLPKRSIYIRTINWYISMFMQSGLTTKWQSDSKFYFRLEHRLKNQVYYRDSKVKINMGHLEVAFLTLGVGYVLSTLILIIEIYRRRKRTKNSIDYQWRKKNLILCWQCGYALGKNCNDNITNVVTVEWKWRCQRLMIAFRNQLIYIFDLMPERCHWAFTVTWWKVFIRKDKENLSMVLYVTLQAIIKQISDADVKNL